MRSAHWDEVAAWERQNPKCEVCGNRYVSVDLETTMCYRCTVLLNLGFTRVEAAMSTPLPAWHRRRARRRLRPQIAVPAGLVVLGIVALLVIASIPR